MIENLVVVLFLTTINVLMLCHSSHHSNLKPLSNSEASWGEQAGALLRKGHGHLTSGAGHGIWLRGGVCGGGLHELRELHERAGGCGGEGRGSGGGTQACFPHLDTGFKAQEHWQ